MEKPNILRRLTDKLFGGIDMKWWKVIVFAVATAVITAVFLIVPIFQHTSFLRMGEQFEAWILFAVIIMVNCKKPLESALKTFVFFLISQPLIYLLQVPFSDLGWQLFMYYKYWFIWTLLTFPMAFVGWYLRKKNWLSLLILSPILVYLTVVYVSCFQFTFKHFPYMLVTAVFCLLQVLLYLYAFTPKLIQRLLGFFVPLIAVILIMTLITPAVDLNADAFLPDDPVLTDQAVAVSENPDFATVSVASTGKDSKVQVHTQQYGSADFTITDGDKEYHYTLRVYEDDTGHPQIEITPKK